MPRRMRRSARSTWSVSVSQPASDPRGGCVEMSALGGPSVAGGWRGSEAALSGKEASFRSAASR
jgi:hypothetical protein